MFRIPRVACETVTKAILAPRKPGQSGHITAACRTVVIGGTTGEVSFHLMHRLLATSLSSAATTLMPINYYLHAGTHVTYPLVGYQGDLT